MKLAKLFGQIALTAGLALGLSQVSLAASSDVEWGSPLTASSDSSPNVKAQLISEMNGFVANAQNRLAVQLDHAPGWHTYWKVAGDAGLPTRFFFTQPRSVKVSEPQFPIPNKDLTNGILSYWHKGTTLYPFTVDVPRNDYAPGQNITLNVKVEYLACSDICVPGATSASLTLPVKVAADPSPNAEKVAQAFDELPEAATINSLTATFDPAKHKVALSFDVKDAKVNKTLEFFPITPGVVDNHQPVMLHLDPQGNTTITLSADAQLKPDAVHELQGLLVADNGPGQGGWAIETHMPLQTGTITDAGSVQTGNAGAVDITFWSALALALVGGLILNLMPCVFPVLSLKLLGLVKGRAHGESLAAHGWAFTIGVLVTMGSVAGLLLVLRAVGLGLGWGFQLQNPIVVSGLLLLFVVITLNLWGVFEFTLGSGVANTQVGSKATGAASSFWTGVLAVVVASPCTAPFMGAALGYALTQPAYVALAIFLSLGLGMALPWLVLTLVPALIALLPRPGAWMETFRKVMAIPMLGAVVWLGWVLSKQINTNGLLVMVAASATLAVALWLYGREQWGKGRQRLLMSVMLAFTLGAFALVSANFFARSIDVEAVKGDWKPWSTEAVEQALHDGRPAFVDFTAAWCITCQVNKVTTLHRDSALKQFQDKNVALFIGDWTNQDPRITKVLDQFHRPGVPLYLLYQPNGEVTVLPEVLTPQVLQEYLDKLP